MLKLGNKSISDLFIGQKAATKAFLGQKLVWQKATGLPYDAEVEYLESTGTQWIDTRIYPSSSMSVEVMYKISSAQLNTCIFSARTSATSNSFSIWNDINGHYRFDYTASYADNKDGPSSIVGSYVTLKKDGNRNYVNGIETAANTAKTFSCVQTAYLFAMNNGGVADFFVSAMCASCKIWDNGVLVRDFVPVRVGGVGYMYDRVSKQLFGNQGSGNFIVGPDVVEVEYLESTGTQYINTLVSLDSADVVTLKGSMSNRNSFFGIFKTNASYNLTGSGSSSLFRFAGASKSLATALDTPYIFKCGSAFEVNGTVVGQFTDTFTGGTYCTLFARNSAATMTGETLSDFLQGKIYWLKIEKAGVLVRDFVPVRVGMEGAMMDRLTRKIYRNAGTGAFKFGADRKETPLMCNSYVKDGLVAMWDGVENAGWGTHDSNAPINLIDGVRLRTRGTTSVSDNAFNTEASSWYIADVSGFKDALNNKNFTFESVLSNERASNNGTFSIGNRGLWIYANGTYNVGTVNAMTTLYSTGISPTYQTDGVYSVNVTGNSSSLKAIVGGNEYSGNYGTLASISTDTCYIGGMNSNSGFSSGKKSFRCIRLYNRALSSEEIAWNYEIDKRRFNLT